MLHCSTLTKHRSCKADFGAHSRTAQSCRERQAERSDLRRLVDAPASGEFGTFLPLSPANPLSCEANGVLGASPGDRSAPFKLEVATFGTDGAPRSVGNGAGSRAACATAIGPREPPPRGPHSARPKSSWRPRSHRGFRRLKFHACPAKSAGDQSRGAEQPADRTRRA